MGANRVFATTVVAVLAGAAGGYFLTRGNGGGLTNWAVDCESTAGIGAAVAIHGKPLKPDELRLTDKLSYLDLLRDFWTRRLSLAEGVALSRLVEGNGAEPVAEPGDARVNAIYEASKKSFPTNMKREEIFANLRKMLRSQDIYRASAERRIKAVREGSLTYVGAPACGPVLAEIRDLPGAGNVEFLMVGSFFCSECRGNFGYIDRWLDQQNAAGKKVSFDHLALATVDNSADFVMARAEICMQTGYGERLLQFLRLAHLMPTQAAASVHAGAEGLKAILAEMQIDEAGFRKCFDSSEVNAAVRRRVELFRDLNPLSANVLLYKSRPLVIRRDRPEEIPGILQSLMN